MADSRKKVILRRSEGPPLFGYLPASGFLQDGAVSLLDLEGHNTSVPLSAIQAIFFVRDFNRGDRFNPERLTRRTFAGRPRGEGVWVRLGLRDGGETLEGLVPLDQTLLDDLTQDGGLQLAPPDTRSNTLRIFVPRAAIADFRVLGVIGAPRPHQDRATAAPSTPLPSHPALQEQLFEPSPGAPAAAPLKQRPLRAGSR